MTPFEVKNRYRDRICSRYLADDPELSALVLARISRFLPHEIPGGGKGQLAGINSKWRFLRYDVNGRFGYHIDGREISNGTDERNIVESRLTCQIYLNDGESEYSGGELVFGKKSASGTIEDMHVHVPKAGDAVIFLQELPPQIPPPPTDSASGYTFPQQFEYQCLHKSNAITRGHKYCCRAMIDYSKPRPSPS